MKTKTSLSPTNMVNTVDVWVKYPRDDAMKAFDEKWPNPSLCSLEQLAAYFLACIDGVLEPPNIYYEELFRRWHLYLTNVRNRQFARIVVQHLFLQRNGQDTLAVAISKHAQEMMRKVSPDMYHEIFSLMFNGIDLQLLVDIEAQYQHFVCRKTASQEVMMDGALDKALSIDFFTRAFAIHMKWFQACIDGCIASSWAIPPQARSLSGMWYVSQGEFEKRLTWFCPFALNLVRSKMVRSYGGVLSGSVLPLCALKHEVYTGTREEFMAFAQEVYPKCSLDIFMACHPVVSSGASLEHRATEFLALLGSITSSMWQEVRKVSWVEDGPDWSVRNRRGITFYFKSPAYLFEVQLILIIDENADSDIAKAVAHQHLPCVRARYDGTALHVTASCFVAWMTRFVERPPLFGSMVSQQRKSKIVFKYAMRGWGFSSAAVQDLQLPSTLLEWLRDWGHTPLPAYHPLYNPNLWRKFMTADRVKELIECAEI